MISIFSLRVRVSLRVRKCLESKFTLFILATKKYYFVPCVDLLLAKYRVEFRVNLTWGFILTGAYSNVLLPGLSLRVGGRGFSPDYYVRAPATFIGKQKRNRTKRNPQLFDSSRRLLVVFTRQLEILVTSLSCYLDFRCSFETRGPNCFHTSAVEVHRLKHCLTANTAAKQPG